MEKILVICHLKNTECNGQITKTRDIISFLTSHGFDVDIFNYGEMNFFEKFFKSFKIVKKYRKIIIMPGGRRALFFYTKLLSRKNIEAHYIAVGGWVLNLIENKKYKQHFKKLKKFKGIYLQNIKAVESFKSKGFKNVFFISNFSSRKPLSPEQFKNKLLSYENMREFKFCFFARVTKEKGVLLAINSIIYAQKLLPNKNITLDIYGEITDLSFKSQLLKITQEYDFIKLKGTITGDGAIEILSNYYCLLFPSYYHGEGTPHSIIEAFMAGLPVIASNWAYNSEIITDKYNGLIFELFTEDLNESVVWAIKNPTKIASFSKNAYESSKKYSPDSLKPLLENIIN